MNDHSMNYTVNYCKPAEDDDDEHSKACKRKNREELEILGKKCFVIDDIFSLQVFMSLFYAILKKKKIEKNNN